MRAYLYLFSTALVFFLFQSCSNDNTSNPKAVDSKQVASSEIPILNYTVVNSYPHDITSFTEGFLFHNSELYESTGATPDLPQTRSLFGPVDLSTGKINPKAELDREKYFGEGITFLNGKAYQLTYKTKIGFVYDAITFDKIGQFTLPSNEGWGLTTDGKHLIMSDGSNTLTYINPKSLSVTKSISVTENNYAKDYLNELEFINGFIYANVWSTNTIVKIDTSNGRVVAKLNLDELAEKAKRTYPASLEMNGIAFNSKTNSIFITGKMWPNIFELVL